MFSAFLSIDTNILAVPFGITLPRNERGNAPFLKALDGQ